MALVMLPCDTPWWSSISKRLTILQETDDMHTILEVMQRIHDLCNVSLDPDEDKRDTTIFDGFKNYMLNDITDDECQHLKTVTLRNLAKRAQSLKALRPPRGLSFSLQQQPDKVILNYDLIAALLANAFFSTFPKRTEKTHPTLQDFNFTAFFRSLNEPHQKVKFQSFLKYFDWLETQAAAQQTETLNSSEIPTVPVIDGVHVARKVFSGKQWLTIEDWLECSIPLCAMEIRHESRIERAHDGVVQTVFASSRIGGGFLAGGWSQECLEFTLLPELIAILLYAEALEDNEVLFIENLRQINRFMIDSSKQPFLESLQQSRKVSVCLMDAENYSKFPDSQFEEDNVLRELNKCLLAFRQNSTSPIITNTGATNTNVNRINSMSSTDSASELSSPKEREPKRLSPIGESGRNSPRDITQIFIRQPSSSTKRSSYDSDRIMNTIEKRRSWLAASPIGGSSSKDGGSNVPSVVTGPTASGRRGRFIVLGSSGECLPVNRVMAKREMFAKSLNGRTESNSVYSSCNSSDDNDNNGIEDETYFSAKTSFDDFVEVWNEEDHDKQSITTSHNGKHYTFAEKLRDALRHSDSYCTGSTEDSYAVDISISGSKTDADEGIRIRRGGSRGFVLTEDSLDEGFFIESMNQEQSWLQKYQNKLGKSHVIRTDNNANVTNNAEEEEEANNQSEDSSVLSPELEEVYQQFSKWLDKPPANENFDKMEQRDEAVLNFANSLLKRTLSESFVGVQLSDNCSEAEESLLQSYQDKHSTRQIINARSLSLEVAKHKHQLAAQLFAKMGKHRLSKTNGIAPIATGNWGCGNTSHGDVQLKLVIQWMAASLAGLPVLLYYTAGHEKLAKLDTVCRVLLDRKWTVGELAAATLENAKDILNYDDKTDDVLSDADVDRCFFEKLIGI